MIKSTKKKALGLALALSSALILVACGGGGVSDPSSSASVNGFVPGGDISLVNAECGFYKDSIDSPSTVLSIYAAKGKGDVPYANVNFLESLLSGEGMGTIQVKVEGKADETDDLADTVDYAALSDRIRTALVEAKCKMIERAARIVYELCLEEKRVASAEVAVTKAGAVAGLGSATVKYRG